MSTHSICFCGEIRKIYVFTRYAIVFYLYEGAVYIFQEHHNRHKKNLHIQMIEKKVDQLLQHWRSRIGLENKHQNEQKPIVLRKRRERIKSEANWPLFYYQFNRDHAKPNLIWNFKVIVSFVHYSKLDFIVFFLLFSQASLIPYHGELSSTCAGGRGHLHPCKLQIFRGV